MSVRVGVANFFLGQSIGIDETNTFQLNIFSCIKTLRTTVWWALEWAWHPDEKTCAAQKAQETTYQIPF